MAQTQSFTLMRADRLFDGSGRPPMQSAALLIEDGTVRALGKRADVRVPDGAVATELDYGDATILPGLVDAHTHMMAPGDGFYVSPGGGKREVRIAYVLCSEDLLEAVGVLAAALEEYGGRRE